MIDNSHPQPHVLVLLAAFNGMRYIAEQIESILQQRNVEVQIVVSVDRSTDGTESFLSKWALQEPRLTLLPFGEHFGGAAPNFYRLLRDVDLTGFDYVSFADQDDLWHQEKLWRAHSLMTECAAFGYSSNVTAFWPSGRTQLVNKAQPQRANDHFFEAAGPGCTYVLRAKLLVPLQHLAVRACESLLRVEYHDWFIYAFFRVNNYSWVIDDWSSMQYRQHESNQLGVNVGLVSRWRRALRVLSGHGFEQSSLIADLVGASSTRIVQKGLRGDRFGYLWLGFRANQCRRKRLDRLCFFALCLLFAVARPVVRGGT